MLWVGFETTIPGFELVKIFRALGPTATGVLLVLLFNPENETGIFLRTTLTFVPIRDVISLKIEFILTPAVRI
jgi:hypothetical protein